MGVLRVWRLLSKYKYQNNSETVQGTVAHYQFTAFKLINARWWRPTRALWKAKSDLEKKLISPPRKWLHDASFDRMLSECLTEIISPIPRVTLSFAWGQLCLRSDFVYVKVPPGRILGGGKVPLFDPDIEPLALPFPFHPTLPSSQARLFLSSVILLSWQSLQPARAVHICRLWLARRSCTSSVIMARIFFIRCSP